LITAENYVDDGHWSYIPGPVGFESHKYLLLFGRFQEQFDISGDVGEIGVAAGRYLTLLHLLSKSSEHVLAIDVFEDFDKNFDFDGGATTTEAFLANLRQFISPKDLTRLRIVKKDSLYLDPAEVRKYLMCGGFRLLSIDGAHSWFHTAGDLQLADALVRPGGVVLLDDIHNGGWPGVIEGLSRYLLLSPMRRLYPFMICFNKVWMTTTDYHERFLKYALSDEIMIGAGQKKRVSEFFGRSVVGF
jgi:Methyltransferase domain